MESIRFEDGTSLTQFLAELAAWVDEKIQDAAPGTQEVFESAKRFELLTSKGTLRITAEVAGE